MLQAHLNYEMEDFNPCCNDNDVGASLPSDHFVGSSKNFFVGHQTLLYFLECNSQIFPRSHPRVLSVGMKKVFYLHLKRN